MAVITAGYDELVCSGGLVSIVTQSNIEVGQSQCDGKYIIIIYYFSSTFSMYE